MAEGARLESVYTLTGIQGSNPCLSASSFPWFLIFDHASWLLFTFMAKLSFSVLNLRHPPICTIMVYDTGMAEAKQVRRSITLPLQTDKEIEAIARKRRLSGNRVLVELVELGLEARKQKEKAFFELAERFRASDDPEQLKRLGDELGRFVFGE